MVLVVVLTDADLLHTYFRPGTFAPSNSATRWLPFLVSAVSDHRQGGELLRTATAITRPSRLLSSHLLPRSINIYYTMSENGAQQTLVRMTREKRDRDELLHWDIRAERRRIQNRVNQRAYRKLLLLTGECMTHSVMINYL